MPISDETIRKVQEAANIVEVVEEFLSLKKKGANFWALSPFINEKTPSFSVSPQRNIFKDFSSGKGGDSISFIMEMEGIGFIEAVKFLAKKYSIEIEEDEVTPAQQEAQSYRESLLIVMNFATQFFQEQLFESEEGKTLGLSYFKERGFHQRTLETFGLGYSLNQWDALKKEALAKGFKEDILEGAGLLIRNQEKNSLYDRFRGRVMFPVHNLAGRVVAFGARTLKKDEKPKYLNSPETEVYHKSDLLYGIYQAKNTIRNEDNCYLVEGYTDVISLHQDGILNVVASSGTSLTENQISLIKRFTDNITVLYDGDEAGIKASMRGVDLILEKGMNVRVVMFPDGHDPDSYISAIGGAAFKQYLTENAKDFILFKTQLRLKETEKDPIKRATVVREIIESIVKIPDPIKREVFYQECSRLLQVDEQVLRDEGLKLQLQEQRKQSKQAERQARSQDAEESAETIQAVEELMEQVQPGLQKTPVYWQEREFVRLLVCHGNKEMEDGKLLCEHLYQEIQGLEIKTVLFKKIVEVYAQQADAGTVPDPDFFYTYANEDIKKEIIDLTTEKGELSKNWFEKFHIFTPSKDHDLASVVYTNMLRLKYRHLQQLYLKSLDQMKESTSIDEQMEILAVISEVKKQKMEIAKELGIVIS